MGLMTGSVDTGQLIMKYLITFTLLFNLLVQFNQGLSEIIKTRLGKDVHLKGSIPIDSKLLDCIVIHKDIIYSIYPDYNLTDYYYDGYGIGGDCNFWLYNINFNHAGKWTLLYSWLNDDLETVKNFSEIELHVYKETFLLPKNEFITEVGNYITIFPQNVLGNFTNCTLIHDNNGTLIETHNLMNTNQKNSGLEFYEKCGMRLLVNESRYGSWSIIQHDGPYIKIKLDFKIHKLETNDSSDEINLTWTRRTFETIELTHDPRVIYCKIIQPDGRTIIKQNDQCVQAINPVKDVHKGIWEIQYIAPRRINLLKKKYNVQVIDELISQNINVTVNTTDSQIVHLLCTHNNSYITSKSEFCLFTKPDGTIINLPEAIGNNKYEYYGNGFNYQILQESYSDCGLTIRKPSADDYGLWKCSFGKSYNRYEAYVSLINTDTNAYVPNHIYVKLGDTFSVECPQYSPLKYCRVYHTNDADNHQHTSFFGERQSRSTGICSATVQDASYEHAGYWTCLLGAVGRDEIKIPNAIKVIVTESYLYSNQREIKVDKNNNTTITMNLLPNMYATIDYCRWERPDGHGIHMIDNDQYSTSYKQKSCSLTINEYNIANLGVWKCFASLYSQDSDDILIKEIFATVVVIDNDDIK